MVPPGGFRAHVMPRFIILIAVGVVAWLIYKLYYQKLRQQGKPGLIKLGLIALGLVFVALAVTGRAHIAFAIIGAVMTQAMRIMPILVRFFPAIQQLINSNRVFGGGGGGTGNGQQSSIRTRLLHVKLDHESGQIDGEITDGQFSGRKLSDLSRAELRELCSDCTANDPEGLRLLHAYIGRTYGEADPSASQNPQQEQNHAQPGAAEASEILGLGGQATRSEIIAAHRKLMGKLHPDKGGSTYLAAKINAAKEVLLNNLKQN